MIEGAAAVYWCLVYRSCVMALVEVQERHISTPRIYKMTRENKLLLQSLFERGKPGRVSAIAPSSEEVEIDAQNVVRMRWPPTLPGVLDGLRAERAGMGALDLTTRARRCALAVCLWRLRPVAARGVSRTYHL